MTGGERAKGLDFAHPDALMAPFVESTAAAFRSGIHLALAVSAALIVVSAGMTLFTARSRDAGSLALGTAPRGAGDGALG
jgi:hypothetical protein